MGVGGVGINAVQGAAYAGARDVVAIDPNPFKLDTARRSGATHVFSDADEAREALIPLTRGQMADLCVATVGVLEPEITEAAVSLIGKAGRVILTSVSRADVHTVSLTGGGQSPGDLCGGGLDIDPADTCGQRCPVNPAVLGEPQHTRTLRW